MKKLVINLAWLVAVTAVSLIGIVYVTRDDQCRWPSFTNVPAVTQDPLAPQLVTDIERDYGWRLGDVIPVEIFIKQQPGTAVDLHSLAIEGDFEMVSAPDIVTRDLKDGSKLIRIRFQVQSMKFEEKLTLKTSMVYRKLESGEDKLLQIPTFQPFTSKTWDGRDIVQDGRPEFQHGYHMWITTGSLLAGIGGAIYLFFLRRKLLMEAVEQRKKVWDSRRRAARVAFDKVWTKFESGDYRDANYKQIARILRQLFRIESRSRKEIENELGERHPYREHILSILDICGKVLYRGRTLKQSEHLEIKKVFDQIVPPEAGEPDASGEVAKGSTSVNEVSSDSAENEE